MSQVEALIMSQSMNHSGTRQSPLARLWTLLNQPIHPYRPATTVFLDLNVDRLADDLKLAERGRERGTQNRPPTDAQTMDDVEHQLIERVEAHKQDAHTLYLDHLHTYDERITALSFEERFATIQQAAPEAVGDFEAEATVGRDELFAAGFHAEGFYGSVLRMLLRDAWPKAGFHAEGFYGSVLRMLLRDAWPTPRRTIAS
jgi:hypothetical protein